MRGVATIIAAVAAFMITVVLGIYLIPHLKQLPFGKTIGKDAPSWEKSRHSPPTMGGILFIAGILAASIVGFVSCIIGRKESVDSYQATRLFAGLGMAFGFGLIGYVDDYIKVKMDRDFGIKFIQKLLIQMFIGIIYMFVLQVTGCLSTITDFPFIGQVNISFFYYPLMLFIILATVNSVSFTDGVDGLAASVTFVAALGFTVYAARFQQPYISAMAVATAAACLGFLVFNFHPARVLMGSTGSMFLGGIVIALAFGIDMPLILIFTGFVYFAEALSVAVQALSVRFFGKKILRMTPIHKQLELMGWSKVKIVAVLSAVTAIMSTIGFIAVAKVR